MVRIVATLYLKRVDLGASDSALSLSFHSIHSDLSFAILSDKSGATGPVARG